MMMIQHRGCRKALKLTSTKRVGDISARNAISLALLRRASDYLSSSMVTGVLSLLTVKPAMTRTSLQELINRSRATPTVSDAT
jgi:hypothetical protein